MVVLGYPTGQLGNRLFQYAHWMGNAWAYRYSLYNPSFDGYGTYFNRNKVQSIYEAKRSFLSFCIVRKLVMFFSKTVLSICICGKRTQLEIDGFGFTEYATTRNVTCEVLTLSDCVKVQNVWWYRDGFIEM